jgi:hypothetical protein
LLLRAFERARLLSRGRSEYAKYILITIRVVDRDLQKFGTPACASSGWSPKARLGGLALLSIRGATREPEDPNVFWKMFCSRVNVGTEGRIFPGK